MGCKVIIHCEEVFFQVQMLKLAKKRQKLMFSEEQKHVFAFKLSRFPLHFITNQMRIFGEPPVV